MNAPYIELTQAIRDLKAEVTALRSVSYKLSSIDRKSPAYIAVLVLAMHGIAWATFFAHMVLMRHYISAATCMLGGIVSFGSAYTLFRSTRE